MIPRERPREHLLHPATMSTGSVLPAGVREMARRLHALERELQRHRALENELTASLREQETLLREIHHRVKNNLQVISGLLDMQSRQIRNEEDRAIFRESQARIRAMALVHERLHGSEDLVVLRVAPYLRDLVAGLAQSYRGHRQEIEVAISSDEADLPADTVIPLGLIVNELVSNACKHAFPGGRPGRVEVAFRLLPGRRHRLTVLDDGVGLPAGLDPVKVKSLGIKLVSSLAQQMKGEARFSSSSRGTVVTVEFSEHRDAGGRIA
jgi:two-component sensor histidine kinase